MSTVVYSCTCVFAVVLSARFMCDAREWCCSRCCRCFARCPAAAGGWNSFGDLAERFLSLVMRIERTAAERNDYSDYPTAPNL